jgi:hypothetical protein
MKSYARRWSDRATYFGPLTFSLDRWRNSAIDLSSGDDEYPGASLRLTVHGATVILALPSWFVSPERRWVDTSHYEWSKGSGGYWAITRRRFGLSLSEGHFSVHYGRQTMDSSSEKQWGCFLPWTCWRQARHDLYGLDGTFFSALPAQWRLGDGSYELMKETEANCPRASFRFTDFDGEELVAHTWIEEREWHRGEGRFKWLSWFSKPKVSRSLSIEFSGETGKRKGSWKGGTIGHSIEMLPGELHETAFRRYCAKHEMRMTP